MFASAVAAAIATASKLAGGVVTYSQGATDVELRAAYGQTNYESIDNNGVATIHVARDFLVAVSGMIDDSDAAILPKKNDTIAATINGVAE